MTTQPADLPQVPADLPGPADLIRAIPMGRWRLILRRYGATMDELTSDQPMVLLITANEINRQITGTDRDQFEMFEAMTIEQITDWISSHQPGNRAGSDIPADSENAAEADKS